MKIKSDFVTNSSCASFVVAKDKLNNIQIELIKNHVQAAKMYNQKTNPLKDAFGWSNETDEWTINEFDNSIAGDTSMDNFDMLHFLIAIGVKEDDIQWEGCY